MIEIAICDDDLTIADYLETLLNGYGRLLPEPMHIQVFHSGAMVLEALNQKAPFDIIFLDIELGDTTGIAVAEQIRQDFAELVLIFISAHESYCKHLFQFDTTAFLSKPFDEAEVKSLLLRVYKDLRNPQQVFIYHFNDTMFRMPLGDILFFESNRHKIEMITKTDVKIFYGKLDEVEVRLKHPGFVRIHHSILVNLDNVERFEKTTLFLPGGRGLALARGKQKEVRRKIMDYYTGGLP
ncbi:DNA-binding response regulator [Spirochaetia bacterium]|nr:DNA-binding response regulator [Spirochaetia bacterium]